MTVTINYKNNSNKINSSNLVMFSDENFNISPLKKHISSSEHNFVKDLIKTMSVKNKILSFDISSKKKIILVSLKKNIKNPDIENLGGKFYDLFKNIKENNFTLNSNTISDKSKNYVGHFLHGLRLKSYTFEKYKTKKNKKKIIINVIGKNIPSYSDQIRLKAIEEGTFYTRDLVSEPGNILHPDEYARRLILKLRKFGLKVTVYDQKRLKKLRF